MSWHEFCNPAGIHYLLSFAIPKVKTMVMPRISQLFKLFSGHAQQSVVSTSNSTAASTPERPAVFIERRKIPDRRLAERRKVNCHPYLDTRTNNGRRRSFGRRATDEKLSFGH